MREYEKKCRRDLNQCSSGILIICYLITFILIIVWLFKIHSNAKSEPGGRSRYIIEEPRLIIEKMNFAMKIMNHS